MKDRKDQNMMGSKQKRIALVNDITGFGHCSSSVMLPVISKLKVQCCVLPTSILSNHTAYPNYYFDDYTERMEPYIGKWKKLGLTFDGIETGFLGSTRQIDIVTRFIRNFKKEQTVVVVDPVMGDHGRTYATITSDICAGIRKLVSRADIITPNLTEACILTYTPYHEDHWSIREIRTLAEGLSALGPEKVVITGIPQGEYIANYCYEREAETVSKGKVSKEALSLGTGRFTRSLKIGDGYCGTGDIFAAIITADAVNGVDFCSSVKKASGFIRRCIIRSVEMGAAPEEGVCFEEVLDQLH